MIICFLYLAALKTFQTVGKRLKDRRREVICNLLTNSGVNFTNLIALSANAPVAILVQFHQQYYAKLENMLNFYAVRQ